MNFPENIKKKIEDLTKITGKSELTIILDSLEIYKEFLKLQKEFELWDEISDTDFLEFEKSLKNGNISC